MFELVNRKRFKKLALVFYLTGLVGFIVVGYLYGEQKLNQRLEVERHLIEETLGTTLEYYLFVPSLLSDSEEILNVYRNPSSKTPEEINKLLLKTNTELGSDVIYLLDTNGVTIASSNYLQSDSFVGGDYSFRPYFKDAIAGNTGQYLALGAQSGKRGYFFSAPVQHNGEILGVVTVKVLLNQIEEIWQDSGIEFLVYDADGIVFFSSRSDWLYKSIVSHSVDELNRLVATRRYGSEKVQVVANSPSITFNEFDEIRLSSTQTHNTVWRLSYKYLDNWGLNIATLVPASKRYYTVFLSVLGYTLLSLLLYIFWLYQEKKLQLRHHLEDMNRQLELKVNELTGDLQLRNQQLQQSALEQKYAHQALQQAQEELIQTAKMAMLGEFSASLHHELTQPLQAIKSYANNSVRMLELSKTESLKNTLAEINSVVDSMVKIVQQFRIFARRSQPEKRPCQLQEIISGVMSIVSPELESKSIRCVNRCNDRTVFCEPVLVEQVIVNLISNAVHALENTDQPKVVIDSEEHEGYIALIVCDNGPGVDEDTLPNLFEPFFTTRKTGLGLGLAIAKRIVESQGGSISATKGVRGGMKFSVSLPLHE